jgi:lipopolysaccharide export system permease protein
LREQVVNHVVSDSEDGRGIYFLQAVSIDPVTSTLQDIVIYDIGDSRARRTTYADSGTMAFTEDQTTLFLTLYDGVVLEVPGNRPGGFQRSEFQEQFFPMRDINNVLELGAAGDFRSDREMSTQMLADTAQKFDREWQDLRAETREEALRAVKLALGWQRQEDTLVPPYRPPVSQALYEVDTGEEMDFLPPDEITRSVMLATRANAQLVEDLRLRAIKYRVEIHKKWAISFACFVFVLLGAPLALRFPRGGVGLVITASVVVFAIFWAFLIGGEALADRGILGPALSMWAPNLLLLPPALYMVSRMPRQMATARAGGWDDLLFTLRTGIMRPLQRLAARRGAQP